MGMGLRKIIYLLPYIIWVTIICKKNNLSLNKPFPHITNPKQETMLTIKDILTLFFKIISSWKASTYHNWPQSSGFFGSFPNTFHGIFLFTTCKSLSFLASLLNQLSFRTPTSSLLPYPFLNFAAFKSYILIVPVLFNNTIKGPGFERRYFSLSSSYWTEISSLQFAIYLHLSYKTSLCSTR